MADFYHSQATRTFNFCQPAGSASAMRLSKIQKDDKGKALKLEGLNKTSSVSGMVVPDFQIYEKQPVWASKFRHARWVSGAGSLESGLHGECFHRNKLSLPEDAGRGWLSRHC